jgi:type III pantothenate kinase
LPEVELRKPEYVIATTTETAIRSGIFYGQIAMIAGLLSRIIDELGEKPMVIATGGFASLIAEEIKVIETVDPDLTLEGLNRLARMA